MTKGEQVRLTAWRWKVLQQAADQLNVARVCRHFGISRILKRHGMNRLRKVERSHRVDDQEFYQLLDQDGISDDIHRFNDKLREWEDYYNYHRPHGALSGQTPYERLLGPRNPLKELHVYLQAMPRHELLVPLPASTIWLMLLIGRRQLPAAEPSIAMLRLRQSL